MLGKLNRYLTKFSILLMTAALIAGMAGCDGDGGYNRPPTRNLEIRTWYDLDAVRDNEDGNHTLMNDLDSTTFGYTWLASERAHGGRGWDPIVFLRGSFDGQGHEIRDLFINRPDEDHVGLFAGVGYGGVIQDVGVVNAHVTGAGAAGGLVGLGFERGTVHNSYFTGSVTGTRGVGALVGIYYESIISNSYYNYDETLINGEHIITIGALFGEDFDEWLANGKFLDVNERLTQENGYYLINNVSDFKQLLAFGQNDTLKFRLTNDLDLGDDPNLYIPYLAGEFDGNGHRVSDLSFNFDFVSHVGLFGCLASDGKITQVGVETVSIVGASFVGGLVGANWGSTVSDCYATGSVTGRFTIPEIGNEENAGGLVGFSEGAVTNCYFTGNVSGNHNVGGLVGYNYYGTVSNSYFKGSIAGADSERVGGLVGFNAGSISNSYSIGSVSGFSSVGGLVGSNQHTISNSYSACDVTGYVTRDGMVAYRIGGLVGSNHDAVSGCYCTGTVIGTEYVGGLVGRNIRTISDSYSTGSVGGVKYVGGLVGENHEGTVNNCYSTGTASGEDNVGGLVGRNYDGTVNNSFWDTETTWQVASAAGTGKNTTEMRDIITFSGTGWNIITVGGPGERNSAYIWNIVNGVTYPFLSWEPV
ncbi:MAG: GLUG motif-containing protein [Dehalococcoidia bacterium]